MGRVFEVSLEGRIYSCKHCGAHLALTDDVISKSFQSKNGKAYLFNKVGFCVKSRWSLLLGVNVTFGEKAERQMMTGSHVVKDLFCVKCGSIVGWNYEYAHEKAQKYKEGKSVLERFKISGPDGSTYWVRYGAHNSGSDGDDA